MPQASPPVPAAPPPAPRDRVTLVVRLTLVALLAIGVLSIFGDSLLGLAGDAPAGKDGASAPVPPAGP